MKSCDREKLIQFIREVGFAVVDISLYLDTHPCDRAALQYYKKYRDLQKRATEEYAAMYGPLLIADVNSDCYWDWIDEPWPWKGEN